MGVKNEGSTLTLQHRLEKLLLQLVTMTLLPIPEGVTVTPDHCNIQKQTQPPATDKIIGERSYELCWEWHTAAIGGMNW